jgi:hypothetical protein
MHYDRYQTSAIQEASERRYKRQKNEGYRHMGSGLGVKYIKGEVSKGIRTFLGCANNREGFEGLGSKGCPIPRSSSVRL